MKSRSNITKFGMALACFGGMSGLAASAQKPPETHAPASVATASPLTVETANRTQFRALAANGQVTYKGQRMTKADFMAVKTKEWGASKPVVSTRANSATPPVNLESLKSDYDRKRAAELAAQNTKSQADFEKLQQDGARLAQSPQYATLIKEAADLVNRYATAPAAEKARIKQRAGEVYRQLVQMEAGGAAH